MNDQVTTLGHSAGYGISQEQRHKVLRNTYWLLALSMLPTVLGDQRIDFRVVGDDPPCEFFGKPARLGALPVLGIGGAGVRRAGRGRRRLIVLVLPEKPEALVEGLGPVELGLEEELQRPFAGFVADTHAGVLSLVATDRLKQIGRKMQP